MREIRAAGAVVEPLSPEHGRILPYLRREDLDEIRALSDIDPAVCLSFSIVHSHPGYAVLVRGEPVVLFGATPRPGGGGVPWLVATDRVTRHPVTFYRVSKGMIDEMLEIYGYLENWVDTRNRLSVRWLKWAGFTVEDAQEVGRGMFHRFWMRRD